MKTRIPLIIVHTGDSFYLEPVLRQLRKFNPDSRIYLISDESTNHYDFIEHVNISDYYSLAEQFRQIYVHMSINPYNYELFCFLRWFIILDFVTKQGIDHFLCIDSDVMLYCNVDEVFGQLTDYDMTMCLFEGPQYSLFSKDSLQQFCDYIFSHYSEKEKFEEVKKWNVAHGGVSDMRFFTYFSQLPGVRVYNTGQIADGACFDFNMKIPQGFEMQGRVKKIYWKNGLPYAKEMKTQELIRLNALHFQGGIKHQLNKYLYRNLPLFERIGKNILWFINPKRLKSRFFELKKIISNKEMFVYFIRMKVIGPIKK